MKKLIKNQVKRHQIILSLFFRGSTKSYSQFESNHDQLIEIPPAQPSTIIKSISSPLHPDFTHFLICATKAQNLSNCSFSNLFLKFRIHPSIPQIETNSVFCIDQDIDFRAGYSLDFTKIINFAIGDYTPVIELYKRYPQKNDLLAICVLPLSVQKIVEIEGKPITFLYQNQVVDFIVPLTGNKMGSIHVSIALGYPEHQKYLDPNAGLMKVHTIDEEKFHIFPPSSPVSVPQKQTHIDNQFYDGHSLSSLNRYIFDDEKPLSSISNKPQPNSTFEDNRSKKYHSSHHHQHHRKKKKTHFNFYSQALKMGWLPPGQQVSQVNWKIKAKEKGWVEPNSQTLSSIGINVKYVAKTDNISCQTEPTVIPLNTPQPKPPSYDPVDDELFQILDFLKQNEKSSQRSNSQFSESKEIFDYVDYPNCEFDFIPAVTIFSSSPKQSFQQIQSDSESFSDSVLELLNQPVVSELKSFNISDSDSNSTKSPIKSHLISSQHLNPSPLEKKNKSPRVTESDLSNPLPLIHQNDFDFEYVSSSSSLKAKPKILVSSSSDPTFDTDIAPHQKLPFPSDSDNENSDSFSSLGLSESTKKLVQILNDQEISDESDDAHI